MENIGTVRVENDMDIATEEGPIDIKTKEVYIPSTFCVKKAEPEKNIHTIKVEGDMDFVIEVDSASIETEEVYLRSAFCVKKAEPEHSLDLLKAECSSSTEACPMSSYDTEQVTRVKVEHITDKQEKEDPLQITCPSVKREREDTLGETEEQEAKRTSLTHTDARSLAEKRKIPSGTDVEKKEKRYWRSHRRRKRLFQNIRWVNPDAISLTDCVGQSTRFGSNHGGTLMGDVEDTSPKNVEATEGNEHCAADENARQNRDEATAPQEFKEPISVSATGIDTLRETEEQEAKRTSLTHTDARSLAEKRNIPSGTDVEKKEKRYWRSHRRRKRLFQNIRWVNPDAISLTDCVGQSTRFGSNHGGTLMGDVEDTSPKNVEATEGNEHCAADENARQNCDEATAPQEFKEPISVSATGIHSLDLLKAECSSSTEACPMSSYDTEQVTRAKVEHITDTQEEEDPLQITCPSVKREREDTLRKCVFGSNEGRTLSCDVCPETSALRSTLESHQCMHVLEHRGLAEKRNMPSGPQVETERKRYWRSHRRRKKRERDNSTRYDAGAILTDCVGQRIRFGSNHDATLMGDVEDTSPKNDEATEGNEHCAADKNARKNRDETIAEKRDMPSGPEVEMAEDEKRNSRERQGNNSTRYDAGSISLTDCVGQRIRFGSNHGATLMGDVEDTSPKNEEATEGNERCAADENARQNCDEATAPQEFEKPKSVSAAGIVSDFLKSNTEHKDCDFADLCFLQSLIPDMKKLSDRRKRKFKEFVLFSMSKLLDEEEHEAHVSNNAQKMQRLSTIDTLAAG